MRLAVGIESEVREIEMQVKDIQHYVREALAPDASAGGAGDGGASPSSRPPLPSPPTEYAENGDDEGWASDTSGVRATEYVCHD